MGISQRSVSGPRARRAATLWFAALGAGATAHCAPGEVDPGPDVRRADASPRGDAADAMDALSAPRDAGVAPDAARVAPDAAPDVVLADVAPARDTAVEVTDASIPTTLDLHEATLFDNPPDLADWPITTQITQVAFESTGGGVHVEFSTRDGDGSWPDITPPGWDGPLEYTLGFAEYIDGHWYASAAIQFWRGLDASGGNVALDVGTMAQCTAFGHGSSCQVARNWYYDGRWGNLAGYQPATGEVIGVFVVAGNLRGVTDGSQSPVRARSNVVLVRMPDASGAVYSF